MTKLYAVKIDNSFITGEFDRCHLPSLYLGELKEAMLFDSEEDARGFMEAFEHEDFEVECYKLIKDE